MEKFDTRRQEFSTRARNDIKLKQVIPSQEIIFRKRLKTNIEYSLEIYVRDEIKQKRQDFRREVRNKINLYLKTFHETIVRDLTINDFLSEMRYELLGSSRLIHPSTVTTLSTVQKLDIIYSRSKTRLTRMNNPLLHLEAHLTIQTQSRSSLAVQKRL